MKSALLVALAVTCAGTAQVGSPRSNIGPGLARTSTPIPSVSRVTVTDPATGMVTKFFIHDYEDAKIKAKIPRNGGRRQ
jgi:hypothetical protein